MNKSRAHSTLLSPPNLQVDLYMIFLLSHPVSFCLCWFLSIFFLLQSGSHAVERSSGLLEGTVGDSTVPVVSEMKESGSLELEPSVSVATPTEPERAATMPMEALRSQTVLKEGMLGRKHDVEGSGKKVSPR